MSVELWLDDRLNRKQEGQWLVQFLTSKYAVPEAEHSKNYVLNVNAEWGFGKTYFLRNLAEELKTKQHVVVCFDAWKNDFSENALLSFIAEINEELTNQGLLSATDGKLAGIAKSMKNAALPLLGGFFTKQLFGMSLDGVEALCEKEQESETVSAKATEQSDLSKDITTLASSVSTKAAELAIKEYQTTKNAIGHFRENLRLLVEELEGETPFKAPLFILIDELDRCKPSYSIQLLETIKHLFNVEGVYFIVATASEQLSHSINAVYGEKFESKRYLNRFFDQEYSLKSPDKEEYCNFIWSKYLPKETVFVPVFQAGNKSEDIINIGILSKVAEYMRAGLRDIEQTVKLLYSIQLTQEKTDYLFSLPLFYIITLKIRHPQDYSHFKNVWNRSAKSALSDEQHAKLIRDEFEYDMAFAGNTAYKIKESMHIICDPHIELTKVDPSHSLRSETKKDLKDFIKDEMFEANRVRNFKMEKNFSTYIQIVEQAGQLL
ncbi:NTPase [Pseudoalteromonas sp. MM1]|uniref:KAP family P-loop NTPase fold protein n=1 Tax=Pseudoalteromonas sp. MM1 TaxID=3036714 RepID=UPI002573B1FD|nr:P-loop NTPase fold protein [Pseudoalteromonas sp. MM1]BED90742.1 NTPase [Pseudoalteromonas sp. MM1]